MLEVFIIIINMSFYDEVEKLFNIDEVRSEFSLYSKGFRLLVVNGYQSIISFSDAEIVLKVKGNMKVSIKGAKMIIKKMEKSELVIDGEILSVERIGG